MLGRRIINLIIAIPIMIILKLVTEHIMKLPKYVLMLKERNNKNKNEENI